MTVSPAKFEYSADGVVAITSPITIKPTLLGCHYELPEQAGFTAESLFFSNVDEFKNTKEFEKKYPEGKKEIQVESFLKGMHYTAVGWPCVGPKNSEEKKEGKEVEEEGEEGQYKGKIQEEVIAGNFSWLKG